MNSSEQKLEIEVTNFKDGNRFHDSDTFNTSTRIHKESEILAHTHPTPTHKHTNSHIHPTGTRFLALNLTFLLYPLSGKAGRE